MNVLRSVARRISARRSPLTRALWEPSQWPTVPLLLARRWLHRDHLALGWWVELRGDRVTLDGCTFDLSNELVSTRLKGRFTFARYENAERRAIIEHLDPTLPVVELGACLGVVSCITNRRLTEPARHVVVEANPALLPIITRNRELNGCAFSVVNAAVAYDAPEIEFHVQERVTASSIHRTEDDNLKKITVPTVSLGKLVSRLHAHRVTLVADIEGAEWGLVEHEADVLRDHVETAILEVHPDVYGEDGERRLLARLHELGLVMVSREHNVVVLQRSAAAAV